MYDDIKIQNLYKYNINKEMKVNLSHITVLRNQIYENIRLGHFYTYFNKTF